MKFHFVALLSLLLIFSSCEDNSTENSSTGSINGLIYLVDERGNEISDSSGITVSLKERPISTTTTEPNKWHIKDVPMGTYTIQFSKPGFDTEKIFGFQFNGYGDVRSDVIPVLVKPARGQVMIMQRTRAGGQDTGDILMIKPTFSSDVDFVEGSTKYLLKMSKMEESDWHEDESNALLELSYRDGNPNSMEGTVYLKSLKQKFKSGTKVYISARIMHPRYGVSLDNFHKRYYTGLGAPSMDISFIMP